MPDLQLSRIKRPPTGIKASIKRPNPANRPGTESRCRGSNRERGLNRIGGRDLRRGCEPLLSPCVTGDLGGAGCCLPELSLGFWQNFGDNRSMDTQRAIVRYAFDQGVTHFDLANNYGPPYGSAETNFGHILGQDLAPHRDELFISTKAGWDMWPGPYGAPRVTQVPAREPRSVAAAHGSGLCRRLLLASRGSGHAARGDDGRAAFCRSPGKALYVGVSSYSARRTAEAARILRELGTPLLIHQPSYSLLNRWIEESLLDTLEREGVGCIAFTALAQGLLTDKYLKGIPADSRMAGPDATLSRDQLTEQNLKHIRALNEIAQRRGQSLAQMALAWCLRDERITSVVVGASSVQQLQNSLGALDRADFTADELAEIDGHAVEGASICGGAAARPDRPRFAAGAVDAAGGDGPHRAVRCALLPSRSDPCSKRSSPACT